MVMLNKFVNRNLINIKNANIAKKIYIDIYFNKLTLKLLNFFYRKGYILGYVFCDNTKVRVFLKYYKDKGLLSTLYIPKNKTYSYKSLKYLYKNPYEINNLYFFSTSLGFLTLDEIILKNLNIGGILYFYIVSI